MGPDGPPGEVGPRGAPGQATGPPPPPIVVMPPPPPMQEPVVPPGTVPVTPPVGPVPPAPPVDVVPPPMQEPVVPPGTAPVTPPVEPVPPAPPVDEAEMPAGAKSLNSECGKWRDNSAGTGAKPNLSWKNQMKQMAYCMSQDCAQSLEGVTCRYTDPNRLCYTNVGQLFCEEHPGHSLCQDLGEGVTAANLDGPGAWEPLTSVAVFGADAAAAPAPTYGCVCFKNCAHYTGNLALHKYRCTGGVGTKLGAVAGSPAETAAIASSGKDGQCACSCGYPGEADTWQVEDAQ